MTDVPAPAQDAPRNIGRYVVYRELAVGGMAQVSLGKLRGEANFSRLVAIKQLFPQYARDPEFVTMLLDEARVAARVRHPNVVGILDVVSDGGELFLVMEYIAGEALSRLLATAAESYESTDPAITSRILVDLLEGLHAAHTATGPDGTPLDIVHRDVSPQNVLVGEDGVSRVVDFGVAKAIGRAQQTAAGQVKGKVVYMAPEQMGGGQVDLRADIWAAGAVLWEMLAGRRLFPDMQTALAYHGGRRELESPSTSTRRNMPLDAVAMRALSRDPADRYQTAREMIVAIERAVPPGPARRVGQWTQRLAKDALSRRSALVAEVEAYRPGSAFVARARPLVALAFAAVALGVIGLYAVRGRFRGAVPAAQAEGRADLTSIASESSAPSAAPPPIVVATVSSVTADAPASARVVLPTASIATAHVKPAKTRRVRTEPTGSAVPVASTSTSAGESTSSTPQTAPRDEGDPRELHRRK